MRKSAKKEDRGQPWNEGWAKYVVKLNGVKLERCVAADDVEGWADCHTTPLRFKPGDTRREHFVTRRCYGKIELIDTRKRNSL